MIKIMDKYSITLAALAPSNRKSYSPVQVQKLLFLIDTNIANKVDGPHYNFEPYDYGPFDSDVYSVLSDLALSGKIEIYDVPGRNWNMYKLTEIGQREGQEIFNSIKDQQSKDYIKSLSEFVRSLSFSQLVSAVYKAYPEMKVNSVFDK